jgi:protein-S-isoprenylcysteine O-methyltransferase Ste14
LRLESKIGKTTISPLLLYSGKISGYISWVMLLVSLFSITDTSQIYSQRWVVVIVLNVALVFTISSLINLGKLIRLGIPEESTEFKTHGLYKIRRNPMYVGFNALSLSSILFINNIFVLIFGFYSIFVYYRIILGEEKFIE